WDAVRSGGHYLRFIALGGADYFNQDNALFFPPELQFEPNDGLPGTSLLTNSGSLNLNLNTSAVHSFTPSSNAFSATTSVGVQYGWRRLDISRITSRNLTAGQENVGAEALDSLPPLGADHDIGPGIHVLLSGRQVAARAPRELAASPARLAAHGTRGGGGV